MAQGDTGMTLRGRSGDWRGAGFLVAREKGRGNLVRAVP